MMSPFTRPNLRSRSSGDSTKRPSTDLANPGAYLSTVAIIIVVYAVAALFNLYIPRTGVAMKPLPDHPAATLRDFSRCIVALWKDKLGQISLAVTTLFWGAGATLQFIVLKWAEVALGYTLSQATLLQGITAEQLAAAKVWIAWLRSVPIQQKSLSYGFRPGNPAVAIQTTDASNPFVKFAQYGVKIEIPPVAPAPDGTVVRNLLTMWTRTVPRR